MSIGGTATVPDLVEFALATSVLYMAMSVPLSWLSRWSERRLSASGAKGGALA